MDLRNTIDISMDVIFDTDNRSSFSIKVYYWDQVLDIKKRIEEYQQIPVSEQILLFEGNFLHDDLDVDESQIYNYSRLKLIILSPLPITPVGEDFPLTTEQITLIQSLLATSVENINIQDQVGEEFPKVQDQVHSKNSEEEKDLPMTLESTRKNRNARSSQLDSVKKILNTLAKGRNNDNKVQALETEQPPLLNSRGEDLSKVQDSPANGINKNVQVLETEQAPPSISNYDNNPWEAVTLRWESISIYVLLPSGYALKVTVSPTDSVKELRKELKLFEEWYLFRHKGRAMDEYKSFLSNDVVQDDTIEIIPR